MFIKLTVSREGSKIYGKNYVLGKWDYVFLLFKLMEASIK
jgi:hypothetical protein